MRSRRGARGGAALAAVLLVAACGASDEVIADRKAALAEGQGAAAAPQTDMTAAQPLDGLESGTAQGAESDTTPAAGESAATGVSPTAPGSASAGRSGPTTVSTAGSKAPTRSAGAGSQGPSQAAAGGSGVAAATTDGGGGPAVPTPGGDGAAPAGPNGASDTGVTPTSIKLGGYFVLSGPLYDLAGRDPHRLWQAAVRYFNDTGGINGRKYVPSAIDSQIDCGPGMTSLRKAVEEDKIFMIAGSFNPYLTPCAGNYLDEKGVPNLASDGIDPKVLTFKTTFPMGTTHYRYIRIASKWALENLQANSVTVLRHSDALFDSVETGAREVLGEKLKSVEKVAYDEGNLAPIVQRVRQANADVVIPYLNPDRIILLLQEMERQGYKPPKGIHGVASMVLDLVPRSVGKFAEGIEGESWVGVADSPGPGVQEMMRAVGRYAPNTTVDLYSAGGFAGVRLATQVLKSLGSDVTRARFIDAMHSLTNFDNAGLQPPLTYRPGQHEANRCMQILEVKDGRWRYKHNWVCDR